MESHFFCLLLFCLSLLAKLLRGLALLGLKTLLKTPQLFYLLPFSFHRRINFRLSFRRLLVLLRRCSILAFLLCLLRRISALKYTAVLAVVATFGIVFMLLRQVFLKPCTEQHCEHCDARTADASAAQMSRSTPNA